jgi:hypothetical protein
MLVAAKGGLNCAAAPEFVYAKGGLLPTSFSSFAYCKGGTELPGRQFIYCKGDTTADMPRQAFPGLTGVDQGLAWRGPMRVAEIALWESIWASSAVSWVALGLGPVRA